MFTNIANSVAVAVIATPILAFYVLTGAYAPALIILPACMISQEAWLRCGQAWRASDELYQFVLVILLAPLTVWLIPYTLFWMLGGVTGCIGNRSWFDWTTLNFIAAVLPSILYLALRGAAWAESR